MAKLDNKFVQAKLGEMAVGEFCYVAPKALFINADGDLVLDPSVAASQPHFTEEATVRVTRVANGHTVNVARSGTKWQTGDERVEKGVKGIGISEITYGEHNVKKLAESLYGSAIARATQDMNRLNGAASEAVDRMLRRVCFNLALSIVNDELPFVAREQIL